MFTSQRILFIIFSFVSYTISLYGAASPTKLTAEERAQFFDTFITNAIKNKRHVSLKGLLRITRVADHVKAEPFKFFNLAIERQDTKTIDLVYKTIRDNCEKKYKKRYSEPAHNNSSAPIGDPFVWQL